MRSRILWPLAVCVVTAAYAGIPLLASGWFYMRGDTAAQFAPTWYHLGELVRDGGWPPVLDPDGWAGGNYVAEALFGVYNPLNALIWLFVAAAPDLIVSVTLVKAAVLVTLALGAYLLMLEHGAARWSAAALAIAVPFSGYTLYWDAGSWPSGLVAFAYTPWVWWTFRRAMRDTLNPLWAFAVGVLAVLQGNPYGTLAVVVIGAAVLVEAAATRNLPGLWRVLLVGLCVAAFLPLVYLPLLETSHLAARSGGELFMNSGKLRPDPGDLLGLSAPTYVPGIQAITGPMRVPAVYLAWFVMPLLPWLSYDVLRRRARELTGVAVVAGLYLLLTVGPSKLWLFRWPLRLVEYFYLALAVGFALVLGMGLRRDHWRQRLGVTALLLLFAALIAWAQDPTWTAAAFGGTAMLVLLTALLLAWHRWGRAVPALLAVGLVLGSGVVLLGQARTFGENSSSRLWHLPGDVSMLQQRFSDREGRVMQFANFYNLQHPRNEARLRAKWQHYLPGSMYHVAGVDAVNNYTGMGYRPFERALCLHYEGYSRPCGYRRFWQPLATGEPVLADLMKVQTVVVEPEVAKGVQPPDGWDVSRERSVVTLRRTGELPWPGSRLSYASPGVRVDGARSAGRYGEQVRLSTGPEGGRTVFAMLDWPGYTATVDGHPVAVGHNEAGLLSITLPPGTDGTVEVAYRPPGLTAGLAAAGVGTAGAVLLGLLRVRRRRRAGPQPAR